MKETGAGGDLILIPASVEELHVRKYLGLSIRKPAFKPELCYLLRDIEHVTKNPSDAQFPALRIEVIVSVTTVFVALTWAVCG